MSEDTTTIEIDTELRDWLRDIREPPESSYSDTLRRLRNEDTRDELGEDRVREIVCDEVRVEALE